MLIHPFRFVPPTDVGGLPVDAFAVEYKETRGDDWTQAKRRVWPASKDTTNLLNIFIAQCFILLHSWINTRGRNASLAIYLFLGYLSLPRALLPP